MFKIFFVLMSLIAWHLPAVACEPVTPELEEELSEDSNLAQIQSLFINQCGNSLLAVQPYQASGVELALKSGTQLIVRRYDDSGSMSTTDYPDLGVDFDSVHFLNSGSIVVGASVTDQMFIWNTSTDSWDDFSVSANLPQGEISEVLTLDGYLYVSIDEGADKGIWFLESENQFTRMSDIPNSEGEVGRDTTGLVQLQRDGLSSDYTIAWLELDDVYIEFQSVYGVKSFDVLAQENETLIVIDTKAPTKPVIMFLNQYKEVVTTPTESDIEEQTAEGEGTESTEATTENAGSEDTAETTVVADTEVETDPVFAWQHESLSVPTQIFSFKGCSDTAGTIYCAGVTKREYKLGTYVISNGSFSADTDIHRSAFISDEILDEILKAELNEQFQSASYLKWKKELIAQGEAMEPPVEYTDEEIAQYQKDNWDALTEASFEAYYDENLDDELRNEKGNEKMLLLEDITMYPAGGSRYLSASYEDQSVLVEYQSNEVFTHIRNQRESKPSLLKSTSGQTFYWFDVDSDGRFLSLYQNDIAGDIDIKPVLSNPLFGEEEDDENSGEGNDLPRAELSGSFSLLILFNMLLLLSYRRFQRS